MKNRPAGVLGCAYFCISVLIKIFFLVYASLTRGIEVDIYLLFPFLLVQDLLVSLCIYLCCDLGLFFIGRMRIRIIRILLALPVYALYLLCLLITFLGVKFYTLVGTYLTYSLMKYADQAVNFSQGILHEFDLVSVIVLAGTLLSFSGSLLLHKSAARKKAPPGPQRFVLAAACLAVYLAAAFFVDEVYFNERNLYALDRNPVIEMAASLYDFSAKATIQPTRTPEITAATASQTLTTASTATALAPAVLSFAAKSLTSQGQVREAARINLSSGKRVGKFNVILYKFESTCGFYLGCLNPEYALYTPNLDRLAGQGLLLASHYSQEPASLKSLYAMLSGKYSYKTRDWGEYVSRSRKDIFLPQILAEHGYASLFLGAGNGAIYLQNNMLAGKFDQVIDKRVLKAEGTGFKDYGLGLDDRALLERFAHFLDGNTRPFFAFFCPVFPHHPYSVPDDAEIVNTGASDADHYTNALFYADAVIGELCVLLEKYQLTDNTILIIAADHGEALYQHPGNFIHSIYLYQENVYTFCLFSNPRLFPAQVYRHITRHVDIAPSLLAALGIKTAVAFDGVSIFREQPLAYAPFYTGFSDPYLGLRDGKWKYIINRLYNSEELFDLEADPQEQNNSAHLFPELCQSFKEELLRLEEYINRK